MFSWITRWYHARLRRIDRDILWPVLKQQSDDLYRARTAFMLHAANDTAHSDLTDEQLARYVQDLR